LGFDPARPLLLILGGSQGAASLNRFVKEHLELFRTHGLQVLHQCGPGKRDQLPSDHSSLRVVEYLVPVHSALQAATLILCRGGASTLAEVAAARRPAIVVPYPSHTDRHQELNARELGDGVRIVFDEDLNARCAQSIVHLSGAAGAQDLDAMGASFARLGQGDASRSILLALQELAGQSQV
jgi:UDP-N-acetylglucosamine--N-acetylmuramyl-(pentapeptide) pyrophosphoryl-undecaprenol N-acetylglucosamine transferase